MIGFIGQNALLGLVGFSAAHAVSSGGNDDTETLEEPSTPESQVFEATDGDGKLNTALEYTLFPEDIFLQAGADDLSVDVQSRFSGDPTAEGGSGNDTLNLSAFVGNIGDESAEVILMSSIGSDSSNLDLDILPFDESMLVDADVLCSTRTNIVIDDFDPLQDVVVIDFSPAEGTKAPALDVALVPSTADFREYTFELNFSGTDQAPAHTNTIKVGGISALTLEEFVITNNGAAV